jgi:hypothetical protein
MLSKHPLDGGHRDSVRFCDLAQSSAVPTVLVDSCIIRLRRKTHTYDVVPRLSSNACFLRFRFTGKKRDEDSGNDYFEATCPRDPSILEYDFDLSIKHH